MNSPLLYNSVFLDLYFYGDYQRLSQILTNLIANAVKFTPGRGAMIFVADIKHTKGKECLLEFSIADTGIGIPPEKQKIIFEALLFA